MGFNSAFKGLISSQKQIRIKYRDKEIKTKKREVWYELRITYLK